MPRLDELHEEYGPRGLTLVGVSLDRRRAELERMVRAKSLDWPQVWDGATGDEGTLARLFHVEGAPELRVVDAEGRIAGKRLDLEELESLVARLLADRDAESGEDEEEGP